MVKIKRYPKSPTIELLIYGIVFLSLDIIGLNDISKIKLDEICVMIASFTLGLTLLCIVLYRKIKYRNYLYHNFRIDGIYFDRKSINLFIVREINELDNKLLIEIPNVGHTTVSLSEYANKATIYLGK